MSMIRLEKFEVQKAIGAIKVPLLFTLQAAMSCILEKWFEINDPTLLKGTITKRLVHYQSAHGAENK